MDFITQLLAGALQAAILIYLYQILLKKDLISQSKLIRSYILSGCIILVVSLINRPFIAFAGIVLSAAIPIFMYNVDKVQKIKLATVYPATYALAALLTFMIDIPYYTHATIMFNMLFLMLVMMAIYFITLGITLSLHLIIVLMHTAMLAFYVYIIIGDKLSDPNLDMITYNAFFKSIISLIVVNILVFFIVRSVEMSTTTEKMIEKIKKEMDEIYNESWQIHEEEIEEMEIINRKIKEYRKKIEEGIAEKEEYIDLLKRYHDCENYYKDKKNNAAIREKIEMKKLYKKYGID